MQCQTKHTTLWPILNFHNNFKDVRITVFEIYPKEKQCNVFNKLKKKCNLQITQAQFNRLPKNDKCGLVGFLDEELREDLPLRDITSVEQHTQYHR